MEVQNTAIAANSAQYLARGSLRYEFATEILQTPIKLLKIDNAEAQVPLLVSSSINKILQVIILIWRKGLKVDACLSVPSTV